MMWCTCRVPWRRITEQSHVILMLIWITGAVRNYSLYGKSVKYPAVICGEQERSM